MPGSTVPALFTIPTNGRGVVSVDSWTFSSESNSDLHLCASATSCDSAYKPVCVELVPNGYEPSACALLIPKGTEKWLYATYVIGGRKGFIGVDTTQNQLAWGDDNVSFSTYGTNNQGIINPYQGVSHSLDPADNQISVTPATFIIPDAADAATQALGIKLGGTTENVRLLKNGGP
jgi:hypothetical protein